MTTGYISADLYATFLFTGNPQDSKTGLYYYFSRFYDPVTGRFLTEDSYLGSVSNPTTQNRYIYVGDNPTNNVDPTGHILIFGGGGGIIPPVDTIGISGHVTTTTTTSQSCDENGCTTTMISATSESSDQSACITTTESYGNDGETITTSDGTTTVSVTTTSTGTIAISNDNGDLLLGCHAVLRVAMSVTSDPLLLLVAFGAIGPWGLVAWVAWEATALVLTTYICAHQSN